MSEVATAGWKKLFVFHFRWKHYDRRRAIKQAIKQGRAVVLEQHENGKLVKADPDLVAAIRKKKW